MDLLVCIWSTSPLWFLAAAFVYSSWFVYVFLLARWWAVDELFLGGTQIIHNVGDVCVFGSWYSGGFNVHVWHQFEMRPGSPVSLVSKHVQVVRSIQEERSQRVASSCSLIMMKVLRMWCWVRVWLSDCKKMSVFMSLVVCKVLVVPEIWERAVLGGYEYVLHVSFFITLSKWSNTQIEEAKRQLMQVLSDDSAIM